MEKNYLTVNDIPKKRLTYTSTDKSADTNTEKKHIHMYTNISTTSSSHTHQQMHAPPETWKT